MIKKDNTAATGSVQPAGSAKYRLICYADLICLGDEFLRDDCETWEAVSHENCIYVGMRYNGHALVPMRRKLPNVCVSDGPADAPELTRSAEGPFAARNGSTT